MGWKDKELPIAVMVCRLSLLPAAVMVKQPFTAARETGWTWAAGFGRKDYGKGEEE